MIYGEGFFATSYISHGYVIYIATGLQSVSGSLGIAKPLVCNS